MAARPQEAGELTVEGHLDGLRGEKLARAERARAALAERWPEVTFTCRYAEGDRGLEGKAGVEWLDGPTVSEAGDVAAVAEVIRCDRLRLTRWLTARGCAAIRVAQLRRRPASDLLATALSPPHVVIPALHGHEEILATLLADRFGGALARPFTSDERIGAVEEIEAMAAAARALFRAR